MVLNWVIMRTAPWYIPIYLTKATSTIGTLATFILLCIYMQVTGKPITVPIVIQTVVPIVIINALMWLWKIWMVRKVIGNLTNFIDVDWVDVEVAHRRNNIVTQLDYWKYCVKEKTLAITCLLINIYFSTTVISLARNLVVLISMFGINLPLWKVKELITTRTQHLQLAQDERQGAKHFALLAVIAKKMIFGKGDLDIFGMVTTLTRDVEDMKRSLKSIEHLFEDFGIVLTEEGEFVKALKEDLKTHLEHLNKYKTTSIVSPNTFLSDTYYNEFLKFHSTAQNLRIDFDKKSFDAFRDTSMSMEISKLAMEANKIKNEIDQIRSMDGIRPNPIGIIFYGDSGIGKSTLNSLFMRNVNRKLQEYGIQNNVNVFKNATKWSAWKEQARDSYDTGCFGQEWHINDDGFMDQTQKDHLKYITFISNQKIGTVQASVEAKGRPYAARAVIVNCNHFFYNSQTINNPEALARRFPFFVHCKKIRDIPGNGDYVASVDHLTFGLTDGTQARTVYGAHSSQFPHNLDLITKRISFENLVQQVADKIIAANRLYESQVEHLMNHDERQNNILVDEVITRDSQFATGLQLILNTDIFETPFNFMENNKLDQIKLYELQQFLNKKSVILAINGYGFIHLSENGIFERVYNFDVKERLYENKCIVDYPIINETIQAQDSGFNVIMAYLMEYFNLSYGTCLIGFRYFYNNGKFNIKNASVLGLGLALIYCVLNSFKNIKKEETVEQDEQLDDDKQNLYEQPIRKDDKQNLYEQPIRQDGKQNLYEPPVRQDGKQNLYEQPIRQDGKQNLYEPPVRQDGKQNLFTQPKRKDEKFSYEPNNQNRNQRFIEVLESCMMSKHLLEFQKTKGMVWIEQQAKQFVGKEDPFEYAIKLYCNTMFYETLNKCLRNGFKNNKEGEFIAVMASIIMNKKGINIDFPIYRGININIGNYKIGDIYHSSQLESTSKNIDIACCFGSETLICYQGTKLDCLNVEKYSNFRHEEEILLKSGLDWIVVDTCNMGGKNILVLEQLNDIKNSSYESFIKNQAPHNYEVSFSDIFKEEYIIHSISADKACSAGFAAKLELVSPYKSMLPDNLKVGKAYIIDNGKHTIINLVTKAKKNDIPTLRSIFSAINNVSEQYGEELPEIHGPKIESGCNKQDFKEISSMLWFVLGDNFKLHGKNKFHNVNVNYGYDIKSTVLSDIGVIQPREFNIVFAKWVTSKPVISYLIWQADEETRNILKQNHFENFSVVVSEIKINFIKFTEVYDTMHQLHITGAPTLMYGSPLSGMDLSTYPFECKFIDTWEVAIKNTKPAKYNTSDIIKNFTKSSIELAKKDGKLVDSKQAVNQALLDVMNKVNNDHLFRISNGLSYFHGIAFKQYILSPGHLPAEYGMTAVATKLNDKTVNHHIKCISIMLDRDLALWEITTVKKFKNINTTFATYKDISKFFIQDIKNLKKDQSYDGYAFIPSSKLQYACKFSYKEKYIFNYHEELLDNLHVVSMVGQGLATVSGDCGSVLFANEGNLPHKIVGMFNIAASNGKMSIFMCVTQKILEELMQSVNKERLIATEGNKNIYSIVSPDLTLVEAINKLDDITNFHEVVIDKVKHKVIPNTQNYDGSWEQILKDHYAKNEHHPEHGKMSEEITVEMMCDLVVSLYQVHHDWKTAVNVVKNIMLNKNSLNPKFLNADPKGIYKFVKLVNLHGFVKLNVDITGEKDKRKLLNTKAFKELDPKEFCKAGCQFVPFSIREINDYKAEVDSHVSLVEGMMAHLGLPVNHDRDKFEAGKLVVYTIKWYTNEIDKKMSSMEVDFHDEMDVDKDILVNPVLLNKSTKLQAIPLGSNKFLTPDHLHDRSDSMLFYNKSLYSARYLGSHPTKDYSIWESPLDMPTTKLHNDMSSFKLGTYKMHSADINDNSRIIDLNNHEPIIIGTNRGQTFAIRSNSPPESLIPGDCGSYIIDEDGHHVGHCHYVDNSKGILLIQPLTNEVYTEPIQHMETPWTATGAGFSNVFAKFGLEDPIEFINYKAEFDTEDKYNNLVRDGFLVIGDAGNYLGTGWVKPVGETCNINNPTATTRRHIKAPFHGVFEVTKEPSVLTEDDPRINWEKATALGYDKLGNPNLLVGQTDLYEPPAVNLSQENINLLKDIVEQISTYTLNVMGDDDISEASWTEVVKGIPGTEFKSMNLKSSNGLPYTAMGFADGFSIWDEERNRIPSYTGDYLENRAISKYNLAKQGKRMYSLAKNCLKDELRPLAKIENPKSRLFVSFPRETTMVFRKIIGKFTASFIKNREQLFHCVGINRASSEWAELLTEMETHNNCIDEDFQAFDKRELREVIMLIGWMLADVIAKRCGYKEDFYRMFATLWLDVIETLCVSYNTVFMKQMGNPSGCPVTTVLNCYVNLVYHVFCFAKTTGLTTLSKFMEHVKFRSYGDDVVQSISKDAFMFYNFDSIKEIMLQIGQVVTPGVKDNIDCPKKVATELSFLKCGFKRNEKYPQIVHSVLQKDSILSSYNYSAIPHEDIKGWVEGLESDLVECLPHGKQFYDWFRGKLIKFINQPDFKNHYPILAKEFNLRLCISYESTLNSYFIYYFGTKDYSTLVDRNQMSKESKHTLFEFILNVKKNSNSDKMYYNKVYSEYRIIQESLKLPLFRIESGVSKTKSEGFSNKTWYELTFIQPLKGEYGVRFIVKASTKLDCKIFGVEQLTTTLRQLEQGGLESLKYINIETDKMDMVSSLVTSQDVRCSGTENFIPPTRDINNPINISDTGVPLELASMGFNTKPVSYYAYKNMHHSTVDIPVGSTAGKVVARLEPSKLINDFMKCHLIGNTNFGGALQVQLRVVANATMTGSLIVGEIEGDLADPEINDIELKQHVEVALSGTNNTTTYVLRPYVQSGNAVHITGKINPDGSLEPGNYFYPSLIIMVKAPIVASFQNDNLKAFLEISSSFHSSFIPFCMRKPLVDKPKINKEIVINHTIVSDGFSEASNYKSTTDGIFNMILPVNTSSSSSDPVSFTKEYLYIDNSVRKITFYRIGQLRTAARDIPIYEITNIDGIFKVGEENIRAQMAVDRIVVRDKNEEKVDQWMRGRVFREDNSGVETNNMPIKFIKTDSGIFSLTFINYIDSYQGDLKFYGHYQFSNFTQLLYKDFLDLTMDVTSVYPTYCMKLEFGELAMPVTETYAKTGLPSIGGNNFAFHLYTTFGEQNKSFDIVDGNFGTIITKGYYLYNKNTNIPSVVAPLGREQAYVDFAVDKFKLVNIVDFSVDVINKTGAGFVGITRVIPDVLNFNYAKYEHISGKLFGAAMAAGAISGIGNGIGKWADNEMLKDRMKDYQNFQEMMKDKDFKFQQSMSAQQQENILEQMRFGNELKMEYNMLSNPSMMRKNFISAGFANPKIDITKESPELVDSDDEDVIQTRKLTEPETDSFLLKKVKGPSSNQITTEAEIHNIDRVDHVQNLANSQVAKAELDKARNGPLRPKQQLNPNATEFVPSAQQ